MPKLVDTTIRLLAQEPFAGRMPTADLLRLAELLDGAGFACLEVSGGGVFDAAVRRGLESPWERIRALKARTETPLGIALRGRFLVGSRPVSADIVRRFVASAAENGVDVFRLHDPLNDVTNLREAGEAITGAGKVFHAGLVYSPGRSGEEAEALVEQARKLPELGASRVIVNDPTGALAPHLVRDLIGRIAEASGLPVGLYCQGAAGTGLAAALAATDAGADLVGCAVYPLALTLHRVSAEALAESLHGLEHETGVDVGRLWEACDLVDEFIGDEPVTPLVPRIAVRAVEHDLPAGLVAAVDLHLRAQSAGDRLLEVLEEVGRVRGEAGWPPLAAPIGQILASQALVNVLSARRYGTVVDEFRALVQGSYGTPPAPIDGSVARVVSLLSNGVPLDDPPTAEDVRAEAQGLAASEEELVLLAMFGDEAETLLRSIRARHTRDDALLGGGVEATRAERIRELVRIVQESGVAEVEIEDEGMRVSVRRQEERLPAFEPAVEVAAAPVSAPTAGDAARNGLVRVESPMVGTFFRAPEPNSAPFVEPGDVVAIGQTLCILEAMKLMNEVKSDVEGIVRAVHAENAQPVEFGQLLFELEPVTGPPTV